MDELNQEQWQERENDLISEVRGSLQYYSGVRKRASFWQRATSILVMIGSILAPTTIAAGAGSSIVSLAPFGIPPASVASISLAVTLAVAVTEGFRRIFRFEHRWSSAWLSSQALYNAKAHYRDSIVGKPIGTLEWITEFQNFRKIVSGIKAQDGEEFFQGVRSSASMEAKKA